MVLAQAWNTQPWVIAQCEYSYIWYLWLREYQIASVEAQKAKAKMKARKAQRPTRR